MKITLNELTNSVQAVNKLSAFDFGTPKLNYKFMSVVETVEAESKKLIDLHRKVIENIVIRNVRTALLFLLKTQQPLMMK